MANGDEDDDDDDDDGYKVFENWGKYAQRRGTKRERETDMERYYGQS